VPLEDVGRFEHDFLDYVQRERSGIYDAIREAKDLSDDTASSLKEAIDAFRKDFTVSGGEQLVMDEEPAEPIDEDRIERDSVKRRVHASDQPGAPTGESGAGSGDSKSASADSK
jgi:F-type H+/Na+-transporting ATPase subunit alpha